MSDQEEGILRQVDDEIEPLIRALREAGIDTDWSCAGGPGHMLVRPLVQARTSLSWDWADFVRQRHTIEAVMERLGIADYWISLTWAYGAQDAHGGEPVWHIQIAGRFDFLALPAPYAIEFIDGEDNLMDGYIPIHEILGTRPSRLLNGKI